MLFTHLLRVALSEGEDINSFFLVRWEVFQVLTEFTDD